MQYFMYSYNVFCLHPSTLYIPYRAYKSKCYNKAYIVHINKGPRGVARTLFQFWHNVTEERSPGVKASGEPRVERPCREWGGGMSHRAPFLSFVEMKVLNIFYVKTRA